MKNYLSDCSLKNSKMINTETIKPFKIINSVIIFYRAAIFYITYDAFRTCVKTQLRFSERL